MYEELQPYLERRLERRFRRCRTILVSGPAGEQGLTMIEVASPPFDLDRLCRNLLAAQIRIEPPEDFEEDGWENARDYVDELELVEQFRKDWVDQFLMGLDWNWGCYGFRILRPGGKYAYLAWTGDFCDDGCNVLVRFPAGAVYLLVPHLIRLLFHENGRLLQIVLLSVDQLPVRIDLSDDYPLPPGAIEEYLYDWAEWAEADGQKSWEALYNFLLYPGSGFPGRDKAEWEDVVGNFSDSQKRRLIVAYLDDVIPERKPKKPKGVGKRKAGRVTREG